MGFSRVLAASLRGLPVRRIEASSWQPSRSLLRVHDAVQRVWASSPRHFSLYLRQNRERLGLLTGNAEKDARPVYQGSDATDARFSLAREIRELASRHDWSGAYKLFASKEEPSIAEYAAILHGADRCDMRREAEDIFAQMRNRQLRGRQDLYTSMINISSRQGDTERAQALMNEMGVKGLLVDVMVYSAVLNGHAKRGDIDAARATWQQMLDSRVRPTLISFVSLLNAFASAGRPDLALEHLDAMSQYGLSPVVTHWNAVLKACQRMPNAKLAWDNLRSMRERGVSPNIASFTTVLGAIHKTYSDGSKAQEEIKSLVQSMSEASVEADGHFYETLTRSRLSNANALDSEPRERLEAAVADMREAQQRGLVSPRAENLARALEAALERSRLSTSATESASRTKSNASAPGIAVASGDDWVEVPSAEHGRSYYWNRASGVTQWHPPDGGQQPASMLSAAA